MRLHLICKLTDIQKYFSASGVFCAMPVSYSYDLRSRVRKGGNAKPRLTFGVAKDSSESTDR